MVILQAWNDAALRSAGLTLIQCLSIFDDLFTSCVVLKDIQLGIKIF